MSKLYKELAEVYEAMYATFIDYNAEYNFYSTILKTHGRKSVLELGCGTGNLSPLFTEGGFDYLGLDMSVDMLEIAKRKNPNSVFMEGDMRNYELEVLVDSTLITGRTISYILKNEELNMALNRIHRNLKASGILSFDFIDANRFIPKILNGKKIIHKASYAGNNYIRESKWMLNLKNGMDLNWDSVYSKETAGKYEEIGQNKEVIRCFTKNEIELFLQINSFEILELIDRKTYAFPTYVVVAKKI